MVFVTKMRTGLIALMVALSLIALSGCAQQQKEEAPAEQSATTEETSQAAPENTFPEVHFLTGERASSGDTVWAIVDADGNKASFADESWIPLGPCTEGYVFVTWETSDYDKEWEQETNKVTHYGIVGADGQLAYDLTERVAALSSDSVRVDVAQEGDNCFVDGLLVFMSKEGTGVNPTLTAVNTSGDTVYTLGEKNRQVSFDLLDDPDAYHDGVICVTGPRRSSAILDTTGKILAQTGEDEGYLQSLGNGYMVNSDTPDKVTDYAGNVLFDVESINVEGDIDKAETYVRQPGAGGIVVVSAEKVNPYGGANKHLYGIYSISANKWIVPLCEGFNGQNVIADDGVVCVTVNDKLYLSEGYGAEVGNNPESYTCLMDYEGNVILDADTDLSEYMPDGRSFALDEIDPEYLQDGIWKLADAASGKTVLVHIADGAIQAAKTVDFSIRGSYPNNAS